MLHNVFKEEGDPCKFRYYWSKGVIQLQSLILLLWFFFFLELQEIQLALRYVQ